MISWSRREDNIKTDLKNKLEGCGLDSGSVAAYFEKVMKHCDGKCEKVL
jgi:hypothetical protein